MFQLLDPVSGGGPHAAKGAHGSLVTALEPNGSAIVPSDITVYDPPITVWVGDAAPAVVNVVPYGTAGDASVSFPVFQGMSLPIVVKKVLATGTTAVVLRTGIAPPGGLVAGGGGAPPVLDSALLLETGIKLTTEGGSPLELESGP